MSCCPAGASIELWEIVMIKVVVVRLDGTKADEMRLEAIQHMTKLFQPRVIGLFLNQLPLLPPEAGVTAAEVVEDARKFGDHAQVALAERLARLDTPAELKRVDVFSDALTALAVREARTADTFVTLRPGGRESVDETESLVEAVLFGSGRHLLLIPPERGSPDRFDDVMVAWNGSREAARALGEALPYLHAARSVTIVWVERDPPVDWDQEPGVDAVKYLDAHGIRAAKVTVKARDVGAALAEEARSRAPALLVTGAYGHSRLREWLLGGATRHLLRHAPVPLLIAH
jgi:nucleotide-binding universal stress UspA family protein